jgi:hypothetical protein
LNDKNIKRRAKEGTLNEHVSKQTKCNQLLLCIHASKLWFDLLKKYSKGDIDSEMVPKVMGGIVIIITFIMLIFMGHLLIFASK